MSTNANPVSPGWGVHVAGHQFDLEYWERALKLPFEPWCERVISREEHILVLRSGAFEQLPNAIAVRELGLPLIDRINGALAIASGADPLRFVAIVKIAEDGSVSSHFFAEMHERIRTMVTATAEVRDAAGNLVAPPPPQPSLAQRWIDAAQENDEIADMLVFAGRSDNWFDIYKAVELAQRLVGSRHHLRRLLGSSADECERMWRTANSYRHARDNNRPPVLTTLSEAKPLLAHLIRTVLANRLG